MDPCRMTLRDLLIGSGQQLEGQVLRIRDGAETALGRLDDLGSPTYEFVTSGGSAKRSS